VVARNGSDWTVYALSDQNNAQTGIMCRAVCFGGGAITSPIVISANQTGGTSITLPSSQ